MERNEARQEIRSSWREIAPEFLTEARKTANGEPTYICPFCGNGSGESGDGMAINPKSPDGNGFKCFVCGWHGDIIDLFMNHYGTDYNNALNQLADFLNITIDPYSFTGSSAPAAARPVQETPAGPIEKADYTEFYKTCAARLQNSPEALDYIKSRGISRALAEAYYLGYDPAWKSPAALAKGYNPPASPRLIIPSSRSHYVARDIRPDVKEYKKQNEGSPCIFNERVLQQNADIVFITEGAIDALSIIEAGSAAIALNSTSNAEAFIKAMEQQHTDTTFIICMDNDSGGQRAAKALQEGLQRLNISFIAADICCGCKDPNEALVKDREAFTAAVQEAARKAGERPDNVDFYIQNLMGSDMEKAKVVSLTGFDDFDKNSGGLYPGLYLLAAISSLGKTTFAAQIADQIAARGTDVLFFSLEQSRLEMVSKSLARTMAQIDPMHGTSSLNIRRGTMGEDTRKLLQQAVTKYRSSVKDRLSIIEGNFNCNVQFIENYTRQYIRRNHVQPVVFVDYIQILQPAQDKRQTTKEVIDDVVQTLKRMSRDLGITLFVISSVNRANYLLPFSFESLKETGLLEYTADVVLGMQFECLETDPVFAEANKLKEKRNKIQQAKKEDPRNIELVCIKNRYGISSYSCYYKYYPANDLFVEKTRAQYDFQTQPNSKRRR